MVQLSVPIEISFTEVSRKTSLGAAIELCADVAGYAPKQAADIAKIDKSSWSRILSGDEGIKYPKLQTIMDAFGNDAPVLWMAHDRGYELTAMRKRETELQARLRVANEEIAALRRVVKALA
jgi:plasmid maintenance system antidote protein VapI